MSRVNNKEKYKEYDHNYYVKHKRPKNKIGQAELKIADLEAKLAEMTKKYELASCPSGGLVDRVRNLEQQLAEKDKEIESIKQQLEETNAGYDFTYEQSSQAIKELKQNQIQLAIQELEKVKDTLKHFCNIHSDEYYGVKAQVKGIEQDVCGEIDNKIKELKGE